MRVRVSSVFVTRFNEALDDIEPSQERQLRKALDELIDHCESLRLDEETAADLEDVLIEARHVLRNSGSVPRHIQVEEFLTRMAPDLARVLKHQLLETLLADAAARFPQAAQENSSGTPIPLDSATTI
jgi:hypothetical protein